MKNEKLLHIETIAVHAGQREHSTGDVSSPIHVSTTFKRNEDGQFREFGYSRAGNPTRAELENKLAAICQAKHALAFSSGLAALHSVLLSVCRTGDHIILSSDSYHGMRYLVQQIAASGLITYTLVDTTDTNAIEQAIQPNTRLLCIETPSNPLLKITDLEQVQQIAKKHNLLTLCDNTFAPLIQQPLAYGFDFEMSATTKYFSGHSDITGGMVATNHDGELYKKLCQVQQLGGAVPSPFDCWLLNRSIATLPLRFEKQCENALAIAQALQGHKCIEELYFPGLPDNTFYALATKQMNGKYGAMLSFLYKGTEDETLKMLQKLQLIKHATSLGGVETLAEHRRTAEGDQPISAPNLVRVSVGIEHASDIVEDLLQALK